MVSIITTVLSLVKLCRARILLPACRLGSFFSKYEIFATKDRLRHRGTPHGVRGRKRCARGDGLWAAWRCCMTSCPPQLASRWNKAPQMINTVRQWGLLSSLCVSLFHRFGILLRKALRSKRSRNSSVVTVTRLRNVSVTKPKFAQNSLSWGWRRVFREL